MVCTDRHTDGQEGIFSKNKQGKSHCQVLYLKILERSASSQLLQGVTTCKHSLHLVNRLHVTFQFTFTWKSYFTDVTCSVHLDMLLFLHLCIKFYVTSFTFFMHCNDMLLKTLFVEQDLSTLQTFSSLVVFDLFMLLLRVHCEVCFTMQ